MFLDQVRISHLVTEILVVPLKRVTNIVLEPLRVASFKTSRVLVFAVIFKTEKEEIKWHYFKSLQRHVFDGPIYNRRLEQLMKLLSVTVLFWFI